jgi:hypothetical protein
MQIICNIHFRYKKGENSLQKGENDLQPATLVFICSKHSTHAHCNSFNVILLYGEEGRELLPLAIGPPLEK